MAGIYIHIPFCRKACHYCNFHFSTSLQLKDEFIEALLKEIKLQRDYLQNQTVETIYFGGGTPSLLPIDNLKLIIDNLTKQFHVVADAEITLEANPDDITEENLKAWKTIGINRLSIGVQSFFDEDLQWMNRLHNALSATDNLQLAIKHFDNITLDLIYGTPTLTDEKWKANLEKIFELKVPHLSCYALTVEPKTALQKMIALKKKENVNNEQQSRQFLQLMDWAKEKGYEHYEISNFAKPGYRSNHNSSYWRGKHYLGLGPSAHSYNGTTRQWNVANNALYIQSLKQDKIAFESETLSLIQQLNEYIMISLRTIEGIDLNKVKEKWGEEASSKLLKASIRIQNSKLKIQNSKLILTNEGKLFADGIAAELFF